MDLAFPSDQAGAGEGAGEGARARNGDPTAAPPARGAEQRPRAELGF